jgi:hypothetical protein
VACATCWKRPSCAEEEATDDFDSEKMQRILLILLSLLWGSVNAIAAPEYIKVVTGAGGGIAPGPADKQVLIVPLGDGRARIFQARRDGDSYIVKKGELPSFAAIRQKLEQGGLFALPQADQEDLYGEDTELVVSGPNRKWTLRPPVGCVRMPSDNKPATPQQVATFRAAYQSLLGLPAQRPGTWDEFVAAMRAATLPKT